MKKRVALIYGGEGVEHDVSANSAKRLFKLIDREKYEVYPIFVSREGNWLIRESFFEEKGYPTYPVRLNSISGFMTEDGIVPFYAAIPALHGDMGEDGIIQGALRCAHIPYIGCHTAEGALCADKAYTKAIAEHLGILTAKWITADSDSLADEARERAEKCLSYPMFIKPARLGSSFGAGKAANASEFQAAFRDAASFGGRVIIEECVDVLLELECGFFSDGVPRISPTGKILTNGTTYDRKRKYCDRADAPKTRHGCDPCAEYERKAAFAAERLARFLSLRHLARIDFLLARDGRLYFNEINTFPGMTESSLYPLLTEDMGLEAGEFINLLLTKVAL